MSSVFVTIVCPLFGMLISNGMWLSPLPAVLQARRSGDLGELNPIPWVAAFYEGSSYTVYAILRRDYYVFFANVTGMCLGVLYSLVALTLLGKSGNGPQCEKQTNIIVGTLVSGLFFFSILGLASSAAYTTVDNGVQLSATVFGMAGCCFNILYYTAPLSTVSHMIASKDASSLHAPMIVLNLVNGIMWTLYGFLGIQQLAIWLPNLIGAAMAIFQLALIALYRSKGSVGSGGGEEGGGVGSAVGSVWCKDGHSPLPELEEGQEGKDEETAGRVVNKSIGSGDSSGRRGAQQQQEGGLGMGEGGMGEGTTSPLWSSADSAKAAQAPGARS